jgi:hypothetical protein
MLKYSISDLLVSLNLLGCSSLLNSKSIRVLAKFRGTRLSGSILGKRLEVIAGLGDFGKVAKPFLAAKLA